MRATVNYLPDGTVKVINVGRFDFRLWLTQTKCAIKVMRESVGKPATRKAEWAIWWLRTIGLTSKAEVDAFEERIPLIEQLPDPSRIIRCSRCNQPLSDPISKLYRMGPDCRRGGRDVRASLPATGTHSLRLVAGV